MTISEKYPDNDLRKRLETHSTPGPVGLGVPQLAADALFEIERYHKALRALHEQVREFVEENGEANFYTGEAVAVLEGRCLLCKGEGIVRESHGEDVFEEACPDCGGEGRVF